MKVAGMKAADTLLPGLSSTGLTEPQVAKR
jgi:hypothetical protein